MLNQEDWRCPTCLDLLFKPAVNTCGHVYCFWCFHRAMSPYTPSACPVCRAQYGHLPAICAKLHRFLAAQFPGGYAARREETEGEEQESGAQSPEPEAGPLPPPAVPGAWRPEHFACDSCGQLLCRPAVLNCGHCVCQPTCLGPSTAGGQRGGSRPTASAAGEAAGSPAAGESPTAAVVGHPSGTPVAGYECPACGMAARQAPAVCKQLADLVAELFPAESRRRELEVEAQLAAAAAGSSGGGAAVEVQPTRAAERPVAGMGSSEPATPYAAAAGSGGGPALLPAAALGEQPGGQPGDSPAEGSQQQAQQAQQALSPTLESALRRRQAEGGAASALAQRLEENLRRLTSGDAHVHHGVGCDACGLYPITGRRYKCEDCPDAMGFDLCGDCMDRGVSDIVGRFNQRHTPQHRMALVRPRITAMHMLQAANPELSMQQLLSLLELMWQDDDDDGAQQAEHGQQAAQGQQAEQGQDGGEQHRQHDGQQGQQAAQGRSGGGSDSHTAGGSSGAAAPDGQPGGSSSGGVDFPHLRRGPRPAFDGHAAQPHPSSFAHWHPPAEWDSAHRAHGHSPPPPQQQQQSALGGEALGLIDDGDEEEAAADPIAVHVALERVLQHPPE